jgi:hypothetical protein
MINKSKTEIRVLPTRQGVAWLLQSMALLRAQPSRLLFIAVLLQFMMGLTQLPLIGFLLIISVPALSAGLLQAFLVTAEGGRPSPHLLFLPLMSGARTIRMLAMGALMFIVGILTVSLVLSGNEAMLDPELLSRIEQGDVEALSSLDPAILQSMVFAFLIGISVSGTLSYMTIPLMWFHDHKLGSALALGLRALFVNWKPFLLLGLGLAGVMFPVVMAAGFLFIWAGSAGALSIVMLGLVMILLLAFQLILFGTQYCAFRDIFGMESRQTGSDQSDDSQLVA